MFTKFSDFDKDNRKNLESKQVNEGAIRDFINRLFPRAPKTFDEAFDRYVPGEGPAKTAYGEICRAVSRVAYRWNNDGDVFNTGYGLETAAPSATYLSGCGVESIQKLVIDASDTYFDKYGKMYDQFVESLVNAFMSIPTGEMKRLIRTPNDKDSISTDISSLIDEDAAIEREVEEYMSDNWMRLQNDFAETADLDTDRRSLTDEVADEVHSNLSAPEAFRRSRRGRGYGGGRGTGWDIVRDHIESCGIIDDIMSDIEDRREQEEYEEDED